MLDVADPQERADQAEALLRARKPVALDVTKPFGERTLPAELVTKLLHEGIAVAVDGAVFPAPFDLAYKAVDVALALRNCAFSSFTATETTFRTPLDLSGSVFQNLQLGYSHVLEATLTGIFVKEMCWCAYANVRGFLDLSGSTLGALVLVGASVEGEIVANGATITTLYAQGLTVKLNLMAMNATFKTQISLDDMDVNGSVMLGGAVFEAFFKPSRVKAKGMFDLDNASFKAAVGIDELTCATFSMSRATVAGDASVFDLHAGNVLMAAAQFGGALRFERGHVRGVFDVRRVTVTGDFVLERTALPGGINVAGVEAASLQLLDVTCADVYTYTADTASPDAGAEEAVRPSRFERVSILRSNLASLRPARWTVADELNVSGSTIGYGLIEDNHMGTFVVLDTKITEGLFVGRNVVRGDVRLVNVATDGPVVFKDNAVPQRIDVRLSAFGRLSFTDQRLPRTLACTSSSMKQLMFDGVTRRHALTEEESERYDGCVIDLESSTYEQIFCSVAELERHLAPKPSRQQFVVLERALRQSGFDELGDMVYRGGRTRYYQRLKSTDVGIWLRGKIADVATGYGLSVARISRLTIIVPLVVFALVLLSPGAASDSSAVHGCTAYPHWTTAATAVTATYLGEGSTEARLTECSLVHLVPAHALALPLRLLGMVLVPLWLVIATGLLKFAVKSGD